MVDREVLTQVVYTINKALTIIEMPHPSFQANNVGTVVALGIAITAVAGVAVAVAVGTDLLFNDGRALKGQWSRKRKIHPLKSHEWHDAFDSDKDCLSNDGEALVNKVRWGGMDPEIRAEVWPFLLGLYSLKSTAAERKEQKLNNRDEYENLRKECQSIQVLLSSKGIDRESCWESVECEKPTQESSQLPADVGSLESLQKVDGDFESYNGEENQENIERISSKDMNTKDGFGIDHSWHMEVGSLAIEDFTTWQRIIRLDAVRMNAEWIPYSPTQANVSLDEASKLAKVVGLADDEHLEACRQHHAARLVAILEAYALYDPDTGYCQGMSDLLSPFVALMNEDFEAFWCFSYFMKTSRHNFRTDEVGIRRQLNRVAEIIKIADPLLHEHLVKIKSEDCTFVYRMVVVLLRRELSFEQTLCLWEVMWADSAALKLGLSLDKNPKKNKKKRAPPSNDLLLFTIVAAVCKKRKTIFEMCLGMDDLLKECNAMAGNLDIWELLHNARELITIVAGKAAS